MSFSPSLVIRRFRENSIRVFRYPDFRTLWFGAFFSFMGSWIQNIAQGWLVYEITGDRAKLAWVTTAWMLPMALLGPFGGAVVDMVNRRKALVAAQIIYGLGAIFLAVAVHYHFVSYGQILAIAVINGVVNSVETPARQSLVSQIVPQEDLHAAVPINAMTFNLNRVLGPSVGGWLLSRLGAETCYFVNGLSFLTLIFAVLAIKADISQRSAQRQPIVDLVVEGMKYTWRDERLKTLFLMEVTVSVFGLFYLPMMPAIAKDMLHLSETGLGTAMTWIGVGTMSALILLMVIADKPIKGLICRASMTSLGLALVGLSFAKSVYFAYPLLAIAGASGVMQFNTTNALFQTIAPEHLRGRVLAMHIWALSGFGPLALPLFGIMAQRLGMPPTLMVGGILVFGGAMLSWVYRARLQEANLGSFG
ncbi:MAG: MFS transporter [Armatimonadetes bacterium]|nr:MFS transporter [Armatimonadota bacterium]